MPNATLIISQPGKATTSIEISDSVVSIGRAPDNIISLEEDSNVSRYHAELEVRGAEFWIIDLGSSNGTTVNNAPVEFEVALKDGDVILIGGSTEIEFLQPKPESRDEEADANMSGAGSSSGGALDLPHVASVTPSVPTASSGPSTFIIVAAIAGGLAVVAIIAAVLLLARSGKCEATVHIVSPPTGTTVREPTPIRVEVEGAKCIERVSYQLDEREVVSAEASPFDVLLDPSQLRGLRPGNHILSVVVEDQDGNKQLQKDSILIALDANVGTGAGASETPPPLEEGQNTVGAQANNEAAASVSVVEVRDFCIRLAKEFSSKTEYKYDSDFLRQVQARVNDYAVTGFTERARPFRDVINSSFIGEQGLDQPLGYVLAMSRSRFVLAKAQGTTAKTSPEGLWQMTQAFAESNGYSGRCEAEPLSHPTQRCAALVAAAYSKALFVSLFEGDFLYGVACFGMAPKEAGEWRTLLPPDRSDFWKVIKSPEQRERVVRFFAAGIVGENPQKFGLINDRPLSSLYPKK
ncbi:MAG TPA: FHA domain-containing protein [Pyrinomonadaceae bacterium]|jgi:pSer/pThr/pTyr-binding forkhead associated (FHA) protein